MDENVRPEAFSIKARDQPSGIIRRNDAGIVKPNQTKHVRKTDSSYADIPTAIACGSLLEVPTSPTVVRNSAGGEQGEFSRKKKIAIGKRLLDFSYRIFAFGKDPSVCHTFHKDFAFGMSSDQASAVAANPKLFIVARGGYIVPKERRIERLPSGYSVREARDDSQGRYWFVVTAFEVV